MIVNVIEFLEDTTKIFPKNIAFSDENDQIAFKELREISMRLGSRLIDLLNGVRNAPIAILTDRNIKSINAYLGVLYSGNFYVPINRKMPVARIGKIFEMVEPKIVIIFNSDDAAVLEGINHSGQTVSYQEAIKTDIDQQRITETLSKIIDIDPMYAVFTSGSTGTPKCVLLNHRTVIDIVEQFSLSFNLTSETIFGNVAPLDYSGSAKDIYITIRNGGRMHVIPKSYFTFPKKLLECLHENTINTLNTPTSALRILAGYKAFDAFKPESLEKFLFFGEAMPIKVLNYFRSHYPDAFFANLYGSTEKTCMAYFIVNRPFSGDEILPVGFPFRNTGILILDENDRAIEGDAIGEICVRGSFSLGYYNDIKGSEKTFCIDPTNSHYQERIFRTGDLGKFNERGELLVISRKDSQVKHWGYRVELGEIEAAVGSIDFIDSAFCKFDAENDNIVLFYQSRLGKDKDLLSLLRAQLPKYMIPNRIVHYTKLPLKNNMKIDRVKIWEKYLLIDKD